MAISEKILDFGKNEGKALGACAESYLKWLAEHPRRLREDHRHFAIAAKALLERGKKVEVSLIDFEHAAHKVFYQHNRDFVTTRVHGGYYASIDGERVAADPDKATVIKKALHRAGYAQEVVALLQAAS